MPSENISISEFSFFVYIYTTGTLGDLINLLAANRICTAVAVRISLFHPDRMSSGLSKKVVQSNVIEEDINPDVSYVTEKPSSWKTYFWDSWDKSPEVRSIRSSDTWGALHDTNTGLR